MVSPVTSAYHLYAIPGIANRVRVVGDWLLGALTGHRHVALGLVPDGASTIGAAGREDDRRGGRCPCFARQLSKWAPE
jgi:hypothetical protein